MKYLCVLFLVVTGAFSQWQMFADKEDTYLYNTVTGEVYVKHKMGNKNYQNVFVKMPKGVASIEELQNTIPQLETKNNNNNNKDRDIQLESIKKAQEMMQKSLDTGGM
ncbi:MULTISPECIES: hypothetical protein [unclassified Helicobacter]|uniref:hypothetical protein n=1 Tax=unclassified Helicobacter TaxID=2593540 RepID=UPI000CF0AE56|nr:MULTISPECIES: hypothetical protein [unclassified Helicobacter]